MEEAINAYKLQFIREPYQPLSELLNKITLCSSKSLASLVAISESVEETSTESVIPSSPITINPIQIAVMS